MRQKKRQPLHAIACAAILLVLIVMSFYLFSRRISYLTFSTVQTRLKEITENSTKAIGLLLDHDIDQLQGIASSIDVNQIDDDAVKKRILDATFFTEFDELHIYHMNGQGYASDGVQMTPVQDRNPVPFHERTPGFHLLDEDRIGLCIPLITSQQETVGYLQGIYQRDYLVKALDIDVFEGEGFYDIFHETGDLLWPLQASQGNQNENFFQTLSTAAFLDGYSLDQLKTDIEQNRNLSFKYKLQGEQLCAYVMPTRMNGWYLLSAAPVSYLYDQQISIERNAAILSGVILAAFATMVYLLVRSDRKAKRDMEENRDYLMRVINTVPAPIFIVDDERTMLTVNDAASKVFAKHQKELLHKQCSLINSNACQTKDCAITKRLKEGTHQTYLDVGDRHFAVSTSQMRNSKEEEIGFIEVMQDVTQLLDFQQSLEEKTAELETVTQNLAAGLLVTSMEDGFPILQCNKHYLELMECDEFEVIDSKAIHWVIPDDLQYSESELYQKLMSGQNVSLEYQLKLPSNEERWISLSGKRMELRQQPACVWILLDITERKKIEEQLRLNEERYRIAAQCAEDMIIDFDIKTRRLTHANMAVKKYGLEEVVEHAPECIVESGVVDQDSVSLFLEMFDKVIQGEKSASCDILTYTVTGEQVWGHFDLITIFDQEGFPVRAIGVMHDITSQKLAQMKYQREVQYRGITMKDATLYYEVDLTNHKFVSGHEDLVSNYCKEDTDDFEIIGTLMLDHIVYAKDRALVKAQIDWQNLMNAYQANETKIEFEYRRMIDQVQYSWVKCTIYLLQDEVSKDVKCLVYIIDNDETKQLELSLKKQAQRDLLTGLYNKMTTQQMIEQRLIECPAELSVFMIIDLDDFKNINDMLGHMYGDAVLVQLADSLKQQFRKTDIIGRAGGDEFILFISGISSEQEGEKQAKKVCDIFQQMYTGEHHNYKVSGTLGVAFYPKDGENFAVLYEHADMALYHAKKNGKDSYCCYQPSLPQIRSDQIKCCHAATREHIDVTDQVLQLLYKHDEDNQTVERILEVVSKSYGLGRGYLIRRTKDPAWWKIDSAWHADYVKKASNHANISNESLEWIFPCLLEKGSFRTQDAALYPYPKNGHKNLVKSYVLFGFIRQDEVVAILGFDDYFMKRHFDDFDMEKLSMITMLIDHFII